MGKRSWARQLHRLLREMPEPNNGNGRLAIGVDGYAYEWEFGVMGSRAGCYEGVFLVGEG